MAREMLYDRLFRHAVRIPEAFRIWEGCYRNLPVYDLSSVIPLIGDYDTTVESPVPMRLPHDRMWAEWPWEQKYSDGHVFRVTVGARALHFSGDADQLINREALSRKIGWNVNHIYICHNYYRIDFGIGPRVPANATFGRLLRAINPYIVALSEDWRRIVFYPQGELFHPDPHFLCVVPKCTEEDVDDAEQLDLAEYREAKTTRFGPWPLFLAAGLLHCRNVITEEVHQDKLHQKVKGERVHRPYCSYRVLKLEVPRRMAERNGEPPEGNEDDDGPKQRFHLCRGHFKNLQAARYKEKRGWVWWPAHWRGSIELGRADKSYALKPAGE